jgi:hypothetical protein
MFSGTSQPIAHRRPDVTRAWLLVLPALVLCMILDARTANAASSRICRQLEAELAGTRYPAPSGRAQRFDAAIERQREQMAIAREQARNAGCGYSLSGATVRQCAGINNSLDRMVRNLEALQRDRDRLGRREPRRSRAAILAAIEARGCREDMDVLAPLPRDILTATGDDEPLDGDTIDDLPGFAASGERFRTLCVRGCDGYFYPMSNGATVSEFERDLTNCKASCTGTDMQIFYGPQGSEEIGDMLSTRSGEPYSRMPTAFLHQNVSVARPEGCGCGVAKNYEIIAGSPPAPVEATADEQPETEGITAAVPVPAMRPDGSGEALGDEEADPAGPATLDPPAARSSSIIAVPPPKPRTAVEPRPESITPVEPVAPEPAPANRSVRVVGPEFLPDPAGAIDLRATDPSSGP